VGPRCPTGENEERMSNYIRKGLKRGGGRRKEWRKGWETKDGGMRAGGEE